MECWLSPSDPSVWPQDTDSFALHVLPTWIDILNMIVTRATVPRVKYVCKQQRLHYDRRAQSPVSFYEAQSKTPIYLGPADSSSRSRGTSALSVGLKLESSQSADHELGVKVSQQLTEALAKSQEDQQKLSQTKDMTNIRPSKSEQEALQSALVFRRPTEEQLSIGETMSWPLCSYSLLYNRSIMCYKKDGRIECSALRRLTKSLPALALMANMVPLDYKLRTRCKKLSRGQDLEFMIGEGNGNQKWHTNEDIFSDGEPKIILPISASQYLGDSVSMQGVNLKRSERGLRSWSHVIFLVVLYIVIFLLVCRLGFVLANWSYKNVADGNVLRRWKQNYLG